MRHKNKNGKQWNITRDQTMRSNYCIQKEPFTGFDIVSFTLHWTGPFILENDVFES